MNKVLPVNIPEITYEPSYAYRLAILNSQKSHKDWLCNNFIGVFGFLTDYNYAFLKFESLWDNDRCPLLTEHGVCYDSSFLTKHMGYEDFICGAIDDGYYMEVFLDTYYIEKSHVYMKDHQLHPMFIHGYDKTKRTLKYGEFYNDGKFGFGEVSLDNVVKAMSSAKNVTKPSWMKHIPYDNCMLFKESNIEYEFSLGLFKSKLERYCEGMDIKDGEVMAFKVPSYHNPEDKKIYNGIKIYDLMQDYVADVKKDPMKEITTNHLSNVKSFSLIKEHKDMLISKLSYINELGYLSNEKLNLVKPDFLSLKDRAESLLFAYLTGVVNFDLSSLDVIKSELAKLKMEEQFAISRLLKAI